MINAFEMNDKLMSKYKMKINYNNFNHKNVP